MDREDLILDQHSFSETLNKYGPIGSDCTKSSDTTIAFAGREYIVTLSVICEPSMHRFYM